MHRQFAARIGLMAVAAAAVIAAEPRLELALERVGDPRPHRFRLSGEIMGKAMGLVISWSGSASRQLIR